jgi:hypothetical protein
MITATAIPAFAPVESVPECGIEVGLEAPELEAR